MSAFSIELQARRIKLNMPKKVASKSTRLGTPQELERWRDEVKAGYDPEKLTVAMCTGTACRASRAMYVHDALKEELTKRGMTDKVRIIPTGCHGFCEQGPIMVIRPKGIFYHSLKPEDMPEIVQRTLIGGEPIEKHLYVYPETGEKSVYERDVPFYSKQTAAAVSTPRANGIRPSTPKATRSTLSVTRTRATPERIPTAVFSRVTRTPFSRASSSARTR
jgi:(2Fe-2S) ferredoxin